VLILGSAELFCTNHNHCYCEPLEQVQEAADCLGVDCLPRYVDNKELAGLRDMNWGEWLVRTIFHQIVLLESLISIMGTAVLVKASILVNILLLPQKTPKIVTPSVLK